MTTKIVWCQEDPLQKWQEQSPAFDVAAKYIWRSVQRDLDLIARNQKPSYKLFSEIMREQPKLMQFEE